MYHSIGEIETRVWTIEWKRENGYDELTVRRIEWKDTEFKVETIAAILA